MNRKLLSIPLIVLLIFAVVATTRFGVSNIYYFKAERAIEFWGYKNRLPDVNQIQHARRLINKAISYWPKNPDYLVLRAQVSGWDAFVSNNPALYQAGLVDLRLALESRPAYVYSLALLAEFKSAVGEKDDEWQTARAKVMQYGSHDIQLIKRMENLD